jgi:hypothetical protein
VRALARGQRPGEGGGHSPGQCGDLPGEAGTVFSGRDASAGGAVRPALTDFSQFSIPSANMTEPTALSFPEAFRPNLPAPAECSTPYAPMALAELPMASAYAPTGIHNSSHSAEVSETVSLLRELVEMSRRPHQLPDLPPFDAAALKSYPRQHSGR